MTAPRPDARLAQLLEEGKRFAILTHIGPDGDGLGSAMALCAFLRARGAEARMINPDPVPDNYRFLPLAGDLEPVTDESTAFVESADAVFVLDNGSLERLGSLEPHVRRARGGLWRGLRCGSAPGRYTLGSPTE